MALYTVTIEDAFDSRQYSGEFEALEQSDAEFQARRFYALELDTEPDEILIISSIKNAICR